MAIRQEISLRRASRVVPLEESMITVSSFGQVFLCHNRTQQEHDFP